MKSKAMIFLNGTYPEDSVNFYLNEYESGIHNSAIVAVDGALHFLHTHNIKPDVVVHLDKNHAICIEAKYESGEGSYPGGPKEKEIFNSRRVEYVGQMELQKYMMEELLGVKTEFMFLVFKKEKSETHKVISWAEAFANLDVGSMPPFALDMVKNIAG
jgi:hypothetical protein